MNKKIRILHLEDSQFDAIIVKRELQISNIQFEFLWVTDKSDYNKALLEFSPDIILSDNLLPSFTGLNALKMAKEAGVFAPFILVSGTECEVFVANVMNEGASDYVLKDCIRRLPEAIKSALALERIQKNMKIKEQSSVNLLTCDTL